MYISENIPCLQNSFLTCLKLLRLETVCTYIFICIMDKPATTGSLQQGRTPWDEKRKKSWEEPDLNGNKLSLKSNACMFLFHNLDAGVLEIRDTDCKDTVLGTGNGRMASSPSHSTAEVVHTGQWSGRDEWNRLGHTNPQYAHHNVLILP